MKRILFVALTAILFAFQALAQQTVTGTVTSAEDGSTMPGVSVVVKGTVVGVTTDLSGQYAIDVPAGGSALVFSFVGMKTQEVAIGSSHSVDVVMQVDALGIDEVVVTAYGISREKKSLGYSTQEVGGDDINVVKTDNFVNSISGKVSGVQVKVNGNLGGSTNIIIRGSTSLTGSNQALFVLDGVPINNSNTNTGYQRVAGSGYDYGSAISDLDPNDIESINVLKGAAATALYGSRAANGVIMITTKKGSAHAGGNAIGVSVNTGVTIGKIDKSTFPVYQTNYGAGYGPYYSGGTHPGLYEYDWNGDGTDDLIVPFTEDASQGEKFDPTLMVYQWDAFVPESANFGKATPWVNSPNGAITFFNTAYTYNNSVAIDGANEKGSFRLGYTNLTQTGIMPNSRIEKNNLSFNASQNLTSKFSVSASANYSKLQGKGRNSTGYANNILTSYRQWWQTNVDVQELKTLYEQTGRNVTWNRIDENTPEPIYWDNYYWDRYENVETDGRDRLIGNVTANWTITDNISILGRAATDLYSTLQEERLAVGSIARRFGISGLDVGSGYSRYNRNFVENNYDLIANFKKDFSEDLSFTALLGTNIRRTKINTIYASTNGGLVVPGLYSLSNSVNLSLAPIEHASLVGVNGIYGSVSFGYKDFLYLDGTMRRDHSSTLPVGQSVYYYPSVSTSFIFSNVMDASWLAFGKLRLNYAQVGSDAPFASIRDVYSKPSPFGSATLFSVPSTKNNLNLRPERTKSLEGGLEMQFVDNKFGFDLALYKTNTVDQILPVSVSTATGYSTKYVNAGEIQNKGVELALNAKPVQSDDFSWNVSLNWAKNNNVVLSLFDSVKNLQLGSFQGGVTINARVGEAYGAIQGTDFVRDAAGNPIVYSTGSRTGYYQVSTTSDNVIGNMTPDWNAGLYNSFSYKNWSMGFLIDWQHGGDIFSLDQWYGQGTGLYDNTDYINDLGNPVRDPVISDGSGGYTAASGGLILDGVIDDGSGNYIPNNIRIAGNNYKAGGWARNPNARYVYDGSYIKLRELSISYSIPAANLGSSFVKGATFSFVGNNLWIISKNLPYADPEAGLSSGNLQGYQSGVLPTTRNYGINVTVQF